MGLVVAVVGGGNSENSISDTLCTDSSRGSHTCLYTKHRVLCGGRSIGVSGVKGSRVQGSESRGSGIARALAVVFTCTCALISVGAECVCACT